MPSVTPTTGGCYLPMSLDNISAPFTPYNTSQVNQCTNNLA